MKLKISTKTQTKDTAYAEAPFPVTEMNSIRIALYDNDKLSSKSQHSSGRFVIEINTEFTTPQKNWLNQTQIQLRNRTSKLENIKYKIPTSAGLEYQNWYDGAINEMQMFEIRYGTASTSHCKLGTQLKIKDSTGFRSVLGVVASLAWDAADNPVVLLQMGEALLQNDDIVVDGFCEEIKLLPGKKKFSNLALWEQTMEFDQD